MKIKPATNPIDTISVETTSPLEDRNEQAFLELLERHLDSGTILIHSGGRSHLMGHATSDLNGSSPDCTLRVHHANFFRRILSQGNLGMGEAYMAGEFDVDDGKLPELLILLLKSRIDRKIRGDWGFLTRYGFMLVGNAMLGKTKNVRRHYDIGEDLFDSFLLDRHQTYSCGYADSTDIDVDTLQQEKLHRICRKLEINPGQSVLDIGCGKGGLLIHAALHYGAVGTGVTNSRAHFERAKENAQRFGVSDQVQFRLGDYNSVPGSFERIVSVGMLEHLNKREYPKYFRKIARALTPGGRGLIHAIGCNTAVNRHDPFIQKYIFPNSDTPKLSSIAVELENNSLAILDTENMIRHYAVTARRWLEAFRANASNLDPVKYDNNFKRMWEYYLGCGIAAASAGDLSLYQVLFTSDYSAAYRFQRV